MCNQSAPEAVRYESSSYIYVHIHLKGLHIQYLLSPNSKTGILGGIQLDKNETKAG